MEICCNLNSSLLLTMQHFPFYWSIFFLGASKLSVSPSLHVCNASSHFLTWRTFWGCAIISYGDGKPNLTAPNSTYTKQRGMREKGKTHEWESTPGNRSAQELLHEFRNFLSSYTWVNLFLFLFLCWKFLLQHHSGVGYFQERCSPSVTCVPHLRGRRKRAPSAGKKIKTHVQDKKKTTLSLLQTGLRHQTFHPDHWAAAQFKPFTTALSALEKLSLRTQKFCLTNRNETRLFQKNKSCQPRQVANEQLSY